MKDFQRSVSITVIFIANLACYQYGYYRGENFVSEQQVKHEITLASEGWIKTIYQFEDFHFPPPTTGADVDHDEEAHIQWKVVGGFWWWRKVEGYPEA